jgi:hypothetical protein
MKRFVGKFALFVVLAAGMLLAVSTMCRYLRNRVLEDHVFAFGESVTTLIAGDSHPQAAINPALLRGAENICEGQEGYFFTHYKLKYFLRRNPQVTRVILGFSYQNLARRYQELFISSEQEATRLLESYFVLLDDEGVELLRTRISNKRPYYINLLKFRYGLPFQVYRDKDLLRKAVGAELRREDVPFFGGGFHKSENSRLDGKQMDAKVRLYFQDENGTYSGVSTLMVEYLKRIIQLCEEHGVDLILYNAPLHASFKSRIPEQAIIDFAKVKDDLLARFPKVHYLDQVDESLPNESFGDGDHVNSLGATVVTGKLARLVQLAH